MMYLLILFAISLLVSSIGWKYFIYFFSVGYGFSVATLSLAIFLLFFNSVTIPMLIVCGILCFYGCRLGFYLLKRERKSSSYRKILYDPSITTKKPLGVIITVWLFCAVLYVCQVSPVAFRLANMKDGMAISSTWAWISAATMLLGTLLETIADAQKSKAKKINPGRFVTTGLYRVVRCPNYLGEVVLWTGSLLCCVGAHCSVWQWIIAALGYIGILYVMFSGARRLEIRQNSTYGNDPEYQKYVAKTPILIPLLPLYSVVKYEWLKA